MQIKGIPLIKFQDEEKIKSLQDGILYMNTLEWYRRHENKNGDVIVGDSHEGMLHLNEAKLIIPDTGEIIELSDDLMKTSHSYDYAFCMLGINPNLSTFKFDEKQKKEISSFGDTALLILDSNEFFERVRKAAQDKGYTLYASFVKYYDEKVDSVDMFVSLLRGTQNIAFWKRKSYAYQNEFRFVISSEKNDKDHLELDIGSIKDISTVLKTESLLKAEVIKCS